MADSLSQPICPINSKAKIVVLVLTLLIFLFPAVSSVQAAKAGGKGANYKTVAFKGELLSREIAKTTGIALNPLLCMSALGAYTYFTTEEQLRAGLPWHLSPGFWGPLALVMCLILVKDSSKIVLPKALIVPLDAIETLLEKKASALLALPMLFSAINSGEFSQMQQVSLRLGDFLCSPAIAGNAMNMATTSGGDILPTLTTFIVAATIFVVVWVLSHAFNMLILLCPFSSFDLVLATVRNALVAAVMGLAGTWVGLGLSLLVITVAVWFFPRAMRLVVFGTVMSFDIIVYKILKRPCEQDHSRATGISGFTSCYLAKIPPRTYSTIIEKDGRICITCRPWFFLPPQKVDTGVETGKCELIDGVLSPVLMVQDSSGDRDFQLFRIRAKYNDDLAEVARQLKVNVARETSLTAKITELLKWCGSFFRATHSVDVHSRS